MKASSTCAAALLLAGVSTSALAAPAADPTEAAEAAAGADAASADETTPEEESEEQIIVTGRVQRLYRVRETTSGRLPTEPLASSQTINVVTDELIEDQGARDAQDLYRNIPGVSFFSYAGVTARGFRQEEIFYDGLRGDPYAGFSVPQLFNIDRVEFLKGPAGMLYGPGAPGGLFNYVTERPEQRFSAELSAIVGTGNRFGGSGEITGPLGGGLAGRAGLFYENRDTFRFNAASETLIADGGVSHDFGPATIILQGTHYAQNLDANRLRGVPVDDDGNFLADRRWNHNEPTDFLRLRSSVAQVRIEAEPVAGIRLDAGLRYNDATETQQYHEPRGLFDSDGDGRVDATIREFRDQLRNQETWSFGANAIWTHEFGGGRNRLLIGYDRFTADSRFDGRLVRGRNRVVAGLPSPLSLLNPQYGQSDSSTYVLPAFSTTLTEQVRQGGYVLNELTVGPIIATVGVRHDSFTDREGANGFSGGDETFRAGLVYRITPEISLYGQYGQSFEPQGIGSQDPLAGGPFEPTSGDIIEGGIRTALLGGRIQSNLAAYRIRRRNILQADPAGDRGNDGVDDLVSFGEVTSEGVEFDVAADISRDWLLMLAYAYNDTRITGDNGGGGIGNSVGDRFANAPEHQFGFWTRYQVRPIGLAFALGGQYVSEQRSLSDQRVQPFFVFDASLIWERGPWRALLRVDNLFDRTYAVSGFLDRSGHFPGEPRSMFLEVSHRW